MSEEMDDRSEQPVPAEPIPVAQFEGEFVRQMEAKLPAITLEMDAGYSRGTHLKLEVEVRVRNVRYEEISRGPDKGDLTRQHVLALEEVKLIGAYSPEEVDPGVGGSASGAADRDEWQNRVHVDHCMLDRDHDGPCDVDGLDDDDHHSAARDVGF